MFVLNILCHNLLGTNRPERWVRNVWAWVRIVWVRKIHGYETTGYPKKRSVSGQMPFPTRIRRLSDINNCYSNRDRRWKGVGGFLNRHILFKEEWCVHFVKKTLCCVFRKWSTKIWEIKRLDKGQITTVKRFSQICTNEDARILQQTIFTRKTDNLIFTWTILSPEFRINDCEGEDENPIITFSPHNMWHWRTIHNLVRLIQIVWDHGFTWGIFKAAAEILK